MRWSVELSAPRKTGSRYAALTSARKQLVKAGLSTEAIDAELKPPSVPLSVEYLVSYFNQINRARGHGMNGPAPTSFTELKAFCELMDVSLEPWEVKAMQAMDSAYLEANFKVHEESK